MAGATEPHFFLTPCPIGRLRLDQSAPSLTELGLDDLDPLRVWMSLILSSGTFCVASPCQSFIVVMEIVHLLHILAVALVFYL